MMDQRRHLDKPNKNSYQNMKSVHLEILLCTIYINFELKLLIQSLDYEICDNELYQNDTKFRESNSGSHKDIARWILFILIGKSHNIVL